MKRLIRKISLLTRFSLLSLVLFVLIGAWLGYILTNFLQDQAFQQQEVVLSSLAAPLVGRIVDENVLTHGAYPPPAGASVQALDNSPYTRLQHGLANLGGAGLVRVKVWNREGMVVYSDNAQLIGQHFQLDEDLTDALGGQPHSAISLLDKPENADEAKYGQLLEVYTPLRLPERLEVVGAVEEYYTVADLQNRINRTNTFLWGSILGGFVFLYFSLFIIVRNASRRLLRQSSDNLALLADTGRKATRLAAINDLSRSINRSSLDLDAIFDTALRGIDRIVQHSGASIVLLDEQTGRVASTVTSSTQGSGPGTQPDISEEEILLVRDQNHERVFVVADTRLSKEAALGRLAAEGVLSLAIIPISLAERTLGMLRIVSNRADAFTEDDVFILEAVADQLAVALENTRLIRETAETTALRETNRLKDDFMSMVSHELRTPLASIKGYSRTLLSSDSWDNETRQEFLWVIAEESDKLQELVENLLEMTRIEAGRLPVSTEPILLRRFCGEVIDRTARQHPSMRFECALPDDLPIVIADPRRVEQVLVNLLQNAAKYSAAECVRLSATYRTGGESSGEVTISVEDNGAGIAPEHLPHLFDKFYRANWHHGDSSSGSGLGLTITRALVEAQGGRIWVESSLEHGTTFYFTLPTVPAEGTGGDRDGEQGEDEYSAAILAVGEASNSAMYYNQEH